MSKYYTPELEEFYVGFEFEMKVVSHRAHQDELIREEVFMPCIWKAFTNLKEVFNVEYDSLGEHLKTTVPDSVRVKYLDREDIESLGYGIIQDEYNCQWFKNASGNIEIGLEKDNHLTIRFTQSFVLFSGTIKNKSELKKLLKQLGI